MPVSIIVAMGRTKVVPALCSFLILESTRKKSHLSSSGPQTSIFVTFSQTHKILVSIINIFLIAYPLSLNHQDVQLIRAL